MSRERRFSREFKLSALARMEAGANVSALARELGVRRKYLYQWRERFRLGGPVALRSRGRPTKAEQLAMESRVRALPAGDARGSAAGFWRSGELRAWAEDRRSRSTSIFQRPCGMSGKRVV